MFSIELNNAQRKEVRVKNVDKIKRYAEINMALLTGQDTTAYGKEVDEVVKFMSQLGARAAQNDETAKAEINTIVKIGIEPLLVKQMQVYQLFGNYRSIGMDETPVVHTWTYESLNADIQAKGSDVSFADRKEVSYTIPTKTISAGMRYNYRDFESKNFVGTNAQEIEQIQTTMHNKGVAYVIDTIVSALKNNTTGVKFYGEYNDEPTQTAIDDMIKKIRRMGKVSILGDFDKIATISGFNGYQNPNSTTLPFYTPSQVDEIAKQGYNGDYKGSSLVELPNAYNFTKPLADKTAFETYYNPDHIFFVPQNGQSPINVIRRGGLTTMTGNDVSTGSILTRFDMEIGADVVKGREFEIGCLTKSA